MLSKIPYLLEILSAENDHVETPIARVMAVNTTAAPVFAKVCSNASVISHTFFHSHVKSIVYIKCIINSNTHCKHHNRQG